MIMERSDRRRRILAVFQGEDPGGVVWQPRLEFWYHVNRKRGTLPRHLSDMDLLEVYDYCHASVRYFGNALRVHHRDVDVEEQREGEKDLRRSWRTPVGELTEVIHYDEWDLSAYNTEYKLKRAEDFEVLKYILRHEEWSWDQKAYDAELARVGERGVPQFYFRRSPLQGLFIEHMGFESTIYMLHDRPEVIADYVNAATEADERLFEVLCACPVPILNFGENIDAHMDPPPIFRDHLLPHYRRRTEQLRRASKFVHIHIDGAVRPLLPHLRDCAWDGIEALTPLPQGDVTLEEVKEAMGDRVLLDGIPAVYFLSTYPLETLTSCVRRAVDLFYPRLILGISDEIPPDGDIERVRLVGELAQELIGNGRAGQPSTRS
jgi:hypothetical protein